MSSQPRPKLLDHERFNPDPWSMNVYFLPCTCEGQRAAYVHPPVSLPHRWRRLKRQANLGRVFTIQE